MANTRKPLRLNVGFLISQPIGVSRDFHFDFPKIRVGEDLILEELTGDANIGRTPQGLLLQGDFESNLRLECVRCLTSYVQRIKWTLLELFAFDKRSVSESGLILPEDGYIDLEPLTREYALLEVPINPICMPDCKGLCPVCGQNKNETDCGHGSSELDTPLTSMKSLLEE